MNIRGTRRRILEDQIMISMDVGLQQRIDILGDLESLVKTSFGPCGSQVLITTGGSLCSISKDGKAILASLPVSHPLLAWFVGRVKAHFRASGDNSKSFVLIFTELLRGLKSCHDRERSSCGYAPSRVYCVEMADCFARLANVGLNSVLSSAVMTSPIAYSTPLTSSPELKEFIESVMSSTLQGTLPKDVADYLGETSATFVGISSTPCDLRDRLTFIADNFSYVCQEVTGYAVTDSRAIDGVLIPREFAFYDGSLEECGDELRVLLIACDFVLEHEPPATTITMSSVEQISLIDRSNEQKWTSFVAQLEHHHVKALITVNAIPGPLLAMCRRSGISIIHSVCLEDLSLVSQRTGVPIMFDLGEELDPLIHSAPFLRRFLLGKDVYSHVGLRGIDGSPLKHLVICGPTAATSRSYSASVHYAYKAALYCLKASVEWDCLPDGSGFVHTDEPRSWIQSDEERSVGGCEEFQEQMETNKSAVLQNKGGVKKIFAVYGGGAIEQVMCNALHRFSRRSMDERLQSAATLFAEALEVIPRTLHNNSSFHAKSKEYWEGKAVMSQGPGRGLGIDAWSGAWVPAQKLGVVDSLGSKLALWQNILQTMCDFLKIESIVAVKGVGCIDSIK